MFTVQEDLKVLTGNLDHHLEALLDGDVQRQAVILSR